MEKTGKKVGVEQEEMDMRKLVAHILTSNVNVSKEEYKDILKKVGIPEADLDKTSEEDRTARIKANYYGTMLNMNLSIFNMLNALRDEMETLRAILSAICNALGIDVKEIKSSTDKVNEAAINYLNKQTELAKKKKFCAKN